MPQIIEAEAVRTAVLKHLPGQGIAALEDRGVWGRHIFRAMLDDGRAIFVKADAHPEWGNDGCEKEAYLCDLLARHGLPAPKILALDTTKEVIPAKFIIQEAAGGTRLSDLRKQVERAEQLAIYRSLGSFFTRLHAMTDSRSGWMVGAGNVLEGSPNDHMFQAEVVGSGRRAVELGMLDETVYRRLVRLYEENLPYLKDHRPSLAGSAFQWAIGLERDPGGRWRITKLMDLIDLLYWDPAVDLAEIRYPSFGEADDELWEAFLSTYGPPPEEKRLLLYLLQHRISAAVGIYLEPASRANMEWRGRCLADVEEIMERVAD